MNKKDTTQKINEATTELNRGTYKPPLRPGIRKWYKKDVQPFIEITSTHRHAETYHDSLDGDVSITKKEVKKREKVADHIAHKDYKQDAPVEGDDEYAPAPFKYLNYQKNPKKKSNKKINEDLGVWFGTKKKPKGSKQPKGPWVNICRKDKDGKHPPCGRPEATDKGYPKCRAAGVAGKMTDSQKKAACAQKRKAEKTNPKSGTGNKPKMVSYKPKNESKLISYLKKILK